MLLLIAPIVVPRVVRCSVMVTVTLLMCIGFFIMFGKNIYVGCIVLGCVWLFHIVYFCLGVKTIPTASCAE